MRYSWIDEYLRSKAGVTKDLQKDWNSIKADGKVPDDLLKDLLDKSYQLVLGGFSKKKQQELLAQSASSNVLGCCGTECTKG